MMTGAPGGNDGGVSAMSDGGGAAQPDVGASGRTGTDASPSPAADGGGTVDATMGGGNSDGPSGGGAPWGAGPIGRKTAPPRHTTLGLSPRRGAPGSCATGGAPRASTSAPVQ